MTGADPRVAPDRAPARRAPKLAAPTGDVLSADVWQRPGLSGRDRGPIAVAALAALGREARLTGRLHRALDNALTRDELAEAVTTPPSTPPSTPAGPPP